MISTSADVLGQLLDHAAHGLVIGQRVLCVLRKRVVLDLQFGHRRLCLYRPAGRGVNRAKDLSRGLDQFARNIAALFRLEQDIRQLFVELPESKIRAYKPGRFSFNVSGGRCEACGGNGYKTIEMNFLPDVMVPCEVCHGKRYNRETLEVRYKGKSIADVLDMTINMAVEFFENVPTILNKIKVLQDVGLGYLKLGQPSTTISGGESQRVKLATELAKRDTGRTLYILDEPTTGLHFEDIRVLMSVLNRLVEKGNTVIVIEHNLDVIKQADWIIDIGPEGGRGGGMIVAQGTPEQVAASGKGYTSRFLAEELSR